MCVNAHTRFKSVNDTLGHAAGDALLKHSGDAQDEAGLMKYADVAMYRVKERGKNNFQFVSGYIDAPGEPPRVKAGNAANPGSAGVRPQIP